MIRYIIYFRANKKKGQRLRRHYRSVEVRGYDDLHKAVRKISKRYASFHYDSFAYDLREPKPLPSFETALQSGTFNGVYPIY